MSRSSNREGSGAARFLLVFVFAVLAGLAQPRGAFAIDLADVASPVPQLDLKPYLAGLRTEERNIRIERPDAHTAVRTYMMLNAKGQGPRFRWVAADSRTAAASRATSWYRFPSKALPGQASSPPGSRARASSA